MKVTLFPFLAVLLCTMGAMIMLLVIVAKNVREESAGKEIASTMNGVPTPDELKDKNEEAEWFTENLTKVKDDNEEKLAGLQTKLAIAENETQKVAAEIRRLLQLATQFDADPNTEKPLYNEELKEHLTELKRRQQEAALELAELQKNAAENKRSYSIVPYRGLNGTYRRPIYIECVGSKVIIQPEGIELTLNDFVTADRPDNPFDSVLRSIRQYYLETNQTARGSEPYPLLIVRPSGTAMYAKSLQAVGSWVKDYGYELVNEDWNIEYPPASGELKERLAQQLEISRRRMNGYLLAMREQRGGRGTAQRFPVVQGRPAGNENSGTNGQNGIRDGFAQNSAAANNQEDNQKNNRNTERKRQETPDVSAANNAVYPQDTAGEKTPKNNEPADYEALKQSKNEQSKQTQSSPSRQSGGGGAASIPQPEGRKGINPSSGELPPSVRTITRTVKVRCEADRYVLVKQAGLPFGKTLRIDNTPEEAVEELVKAVLEYQESWGSAGDGIVWKTVLQVKVQPGGEQRLRQLQQRLQNGELIIEN
ncbi:MAG: hypothetical protein LBT89_10345 [Planctomycetaceae bacterium]|nr:hypothetical protein [Planctomycetaceae bacterium]